MRLRQQFLHLAVPGSNLTGHLAGRNLRGCGSDALHLPVGFGPLVRVIREPPARFHRTARRRAQRGAQEWVFDQVRQCVFPLFAGTGQETIHAVLDDAFGDRPSAGVAIRPERAAGVGQEDLQSPLRRASKENQSRADRGAAAHG